MKFFNSNEFNLPKCFKIMGFSSFHCLFCLESEGIEDKMANLSLLDKVRLLPIVIFLISC